MRDGLITPILFDVASAGRGASRVGSGASQLAFAFVGRPISAHKVPPQANAHPFAQPTGVACGDSELLGNIVKGEAELAETEMRR
jgi:hypothetical protein